MKKILFTIVLTLVSVCGFAQQAAGNELKKAPDFTMNDSEGKAVSLYEYIKGKKCVLIDFWASWCAPCRAEGKNVKAIYADYKDKGFTVLGVSMDTKEPMWRKAMTEEAYPWTQVSDLKGFKSTVCELFGFKAIPALYLIDGEGNVLAVNLRGEALRNKIAETLSK